MKDKRLLSIFGIILSVLAIVAITFTGCAKPSPAPTSSPTPAPTQVTPRILTLAHVTVPTQPRWVSAEKPWWDELEKRSGGRLKIEPYFGASLATFAESYNAVKTGVADISIAPYTVVPGRFPLQEIWQLSLYDVVAKQANRVMVDMFKKFPQFGAETSDVKFLFPFSEGWEFIGTTKKPITSLETAKGQILYLSGWGAKRGTALGMVPVSMTPGDVYLALQQGTIDGSGGGWMYQYSRKHVESMKHVTVVSWRYAPFFTVMSPKVWNELPADLQKIVDDWANDPARVELFDTEIWRVNEEAREKSKAEYGVKEYTVTPAEFAKWTALDEPVRQEFITFLNGKGYPGKEMLEAYDSLQRQYKVQYP